MVWLLRSEESERRSKMVSGGQRLGRKMVNFLKSLDKGSVGGLYAKYAKECSMPKRDAAVAAELTERGRAGGVLTENQEWNAENLRCYRSRFTKIRADVFSVEPVEKQTRVSTRKVSKLPKGKKKQLMFILDELKSLSRKVKKMLKNGTQKLRRKKAAKKPSSKKVTWGKLSGPWLAHNVWCVKKSHPLAGCEYCAHSKKGLSADRLWQARHQEYLASKGK